MKFKKCVPAENRAFLLEQIKQYKKEMVLTKEELKELEDWVSRGRSPYDNGDYVCTEGGYPMDFITAQRFLKEETEWHNNHPDESETEQPCLYDTVNDDVAFNVAASDLGIPQEIELPFK